jgi:Fe-S-cluster containining protein
MKHPEEHTIISTSLLELDVLAIYAEADAEVRKAGPVCLPRVNAAGLRNTTSIEAAVLLKHAPAYEKPTDSGFCPFQKENLCTAREPRPLGCRIYFCDQGYQGKMLELSEKFTRKLKDLADEKQIPWHYAPLHHFLDHPENAAPL